MRTTTTLSLRGTMLAFFLCLVFNFMPDKAFSQYIIDNDRIRFGNGSEASINSTGNVQQPFYYNASAGWRKLTFSSYPLDYSFAVGGDKTSEWNLNGTRVDNPTLTGQVIDASGFTLTSGNKGYGTIKSTGTITVGSNELRVETTYELLETKSYVTIKTKVTNLSATTAENVRFWIGTRDDYVGGTDVPLKQKGNLTNGEFVEITDATTRSLALQIITGTEGVLFYTTSTKGNTIINSCCDWANVIGQDPLSSVINVTSDGSYGFYVRMNDLAQNQSDEFTWFYAAGELADLEEIINDVAQASGAVSDITYTTANFKATTTVSSTGYYVVVPRDATAPTAAQIKAGVSYGGVSIINSGSSAMSANVEHVFALSGLSVGTAYDLYFVAEDATPAFSDIAKVQFSTLSYTIPTITTTDAATSITGVSAVSGGNVTADGGQSVTERGICWNTSSSPTISNSHQSNGDGLGTFTASLSSLSPGTTYYVRAYATNSVGTGYGPQISFSTLPQSYATITTTAITSVNENSAVSGGEVTNDGGASVTAVGVCWNTIGAPTIANSKTTDGTGIGAFTSNLTGLAASTTYYVRAYATNSVGTAYGNQVSFTTNHFLNYSPGANGVLSGVLSQNVAHLGNGSAVEAIANENYHFVNWSDGSTSNPRTDMNVSNSINVTANFAPHHLVFDPQPSTIEAGELFSLTVKVTDNNNNVITTANNEVSISIGNNPSMGILNGVLTVNAINGIAIFSDLSIEQSGVGYTLNAEADILQDGVSQSFEVNPSTISHFIVEGVADPHMAGTSSSAQVTAVDIYGNIKTDYQGIVEFSSDDNLAVLPANYEFTLLDQGIKTFTNDIVFKTTGDHYLKVTAGMIEGQQDDITVTAAAFGYFVLETSNHQNEMAGQAFSITITAYDIFDNVKDDYEGVKNLSWTHTASASGNGTSPIMAANGNRTFTEGVAVVNGFKLFNANETPTISVTDLINSTTGSTSPITVSHNVLANFKVETATIQTAGIPFDVTVTARDQYYNTVLNYDGSISFKSSNDALVSYPSGLQSMSGYNGVRTFDDIVQIDVIGTYWFRAADSNIPIILGTQYNIVVAQNTFDADLSTLTVDHHTRIAGEYVVATITPRDVMGNLLGSGLTVNAYLDGNSADYDGPIMVTDLGNGIYTASIRTTSTSAENIISASVGGLAINQTQDIEVVPAAGFNNNLYIHTQPSSVATAGVNFDVQPVIYLLDGYGNIITGDDTTIVYVSAIGSDQLVGQLNIQAVHGVVSFSGLNYEVAETITAEFTAQGYSSATSTNIHVNPAEAAYFTLSHPADIIAGGNRAEYMITRYDMFDNLVIDGSQEVYLYHNSEGINASFFESNIGGIATNVINIPDGNSSATFYFYDEKTGVVEIIVSDAVMIADGEEGIDDANDTLAIYPAALSHFDVSGVENPHAFGDWQSVLVKAIDIFGNIKTDYIGTITVQNTDAYAINPDDYTFILSDHGVKEFENSILFSEPGLFWVTVLDLNEPAYYGYQANIIVETRPIIILAQNIEKEYGESLTLSGEEFEVVGGLFNGDEITQVELSSFGTDATAEVGSYEINIANPIGNSEFDASNYTITFTEGTLNVVPATLTVSLNDNYSKIYGDLDPDFEFSLNGFKLSDDISIISGSIARELGEDVGTYNYTIGDLSAGDNYVFDIDAAPFSINKAKLIITADNQSRVYGEDNGTLTYIVTGFIGADDASDITAPEIMTTATAQSPVGEYDIVVQNAFADNYYFSYFNGTLSVEKAELLVGVADTSRPYAMHNPAFQLEFTGFVNGDDANDIVLPSVECLADSSSDAGQYAISLSGGEADNYSLLLENGTLTITKIDQQIVFDSIPVVSLTAGSINLVASSSSGELVTFEIDNESIATINGSVATLLAFGSAIITANQSGNINYNAAEPVHRTLVIANLEVIAESSVSETNVFPNPSNGQFVILSSNYSSEVKIYSMKGDVVYNTHVEKGIPQFTSLPVESGVYNIVFTSPEGQISKRLIIE